MQKITSVNNELIKKITSLKQKKYRNEEDLFIIEGFKAVEEAQKFGIKLGPVFIQTSFTKDLPGVNSDVIISVTEPVMKKMSSTDTPPEILAVAKQVKYDVSDILSSQNGFVLLLENIKDAGNLGTIIRTGVAGNIAGIILSGETTDVYNPKVVRAAVGNLWKLPIVHLTNDTELQTLFKGYKIISTVVNGKNEPESYHKINYNDKIIVMFGSEAEGLSQKLVEQSDLSINIPMANGVESLNLSISAGIVIYEAFKQRLYK